MKSPSKRLSEVVRLSRHYREQSGRATEGRGRLIRDFPRWLRSQGRNALDDETAWVTYGAFRHLESVMKPNWRVLEYGSGGSTLYFARTGARVVSVEHDPEWAHVVEERLQGRADLVLRPPTQSLPGTYTSTDARYRGMSFQAYAAVADSFPDGHFDLVLIDGRARTSAFAHAWRKVRPGGWIVLDNSDRDEYSSIIRLARDAGWSEHRFYGPHPYVPDFGETTMWRLTVVPTSAVSAGEPRANE